MNPPDYWLLKFGVVILAYKPTRGGNTGLNLSHILGEDGRGWIVENFYRCFCGVKWVVGPDRRAGQGCIEHSRVWLLLGLKRLTVVYIVW